MKKGKIIFLFYFSFLFCITILLTKQSYGLGVGVSPDKIVFDRDYKMFSVMNPNEDALEFEIQNEYITCEPDEGLIEAKQSATITCRPSDNTTRTTAIVIETRQSGAQNVGMLPAVAVKAEIISGDGNRTSADGKSNEDKVAEYTPLQIDGTKAAEVTKPDSEEAQDTAEKDMTPELASIAMLVVAILAIIIYSEVKKKRGEETKTENPNT